MRVFLLIEKKREPGSCRIYYSAKKKRRKEGVVK